MKLQATVTAQESVLEGLKAERSLWGEELAHQGASLSQDRGRMQAKIEALTSEVSTLKKHLEVRQIYFNFLYVQIRLVLDCPEWNDYFKGFHKEVEEILWKPCGELETESVYPEFGV